MDWDRLLRLDRLHDPSYEPKPHRPAYAQDIDRILFSPPFRRLANKTQVHPLYDNDHLHHRLIHSLEVASVGRSLGVEVGAWLADERREISAAQVEVLAGLVQTACMAHDIGNPPFGHSGEAAIGAWFAERFAKPAGVLEDIARRARGEFENFEGNAQGFRILTRTEMYRDTGGMRLTLGALGAFTKYPVSAAIRAELRGEYIGLKKYGVFENDMPVFENIAAALGLPHEGGWWRRHPLAFLMEAADDICYNVMDLEDAYLSGDLDGATVTGLLGGLMTRSNRGFDGQDEAEIVSIHRALAIRGAIRSCVEAFKANYDAIMQGTFSQSLTDASALADAFGLIKTIMRDRIFNAARKTELEVYGRNVVHRVLDGLLPLIEAWRRAGWNAAALDPYHVQLVRALRFHTDGVRDAYDAVHALTDFVSGMTDRYAVKVADMVGRR